MASDECEPKSSSSRCIPNIGLRITLHKKKSLNKDAKGTTTTTTTTTNTTTNNNSSSLSSSSGSPRSPFTPKGRTREEELKDVFRHFDLDNDGKISALELRRYFNSIGEILSQEEAQEVIAELDSDKDGMLEFQDFVKLMDNTKDDDLKKVFEMFEHEKGSGRITPRGLQRVFYRLGDSRSFKECAAMIRLYDADGDGELDFNEFHQMMLV